MKHLIAKLRPKGGSLVAWLTYWFLPVFALVGAGFGVLAAYVLFLGQPDYRLELSADNLKITVSAGMVLWMFYSVLFWLGLGFLCWLIELFISRNRRHRT